MNNIFIRKSIIKHACKRLFFIFKTLLYAFKHPFSCFRLISLYRLKKLFRVIFLGDLLSASDWVNSRFPNNESYDYKPIIFYEKNISRFDQITFPVFNDVLVSIIIPVFNHYKTTFSCLQSIFEHTSNIAYEIIIADDASSDLTKTINKRVQNIKVVRTEGNLGFLKNCNNAAKHANGKYILFLNNDTNVQPKWLEFLIHTLTEDSTVGLVGPKFVFHDGVLQEAGGIVWRDGSAWNYGRNQNPALPEYNYKRQVDYISGACLLTKKDIWDKLGGFDETFAPAYYEDTDFSFQIRQIGYRVIYQPKSLVVHFDGVSSGTDLNSGTKKYQEINQVKFFNKWKNTLEKEHYPNAQNVFLARDRSFNRKTVLIIDHYVPFFDKDAGSKSTFLYIQSMVKLGINVKFLGANFFPHQPYTQALQDLGVEVIYGENYAKNWKEWINTNAKYIDIIYLHRPHITEVFIDYLSSLNPKPKLIYFGHDLHFLRTEREANTKSDDSYLKESEKWKKRELEIFNKVDTVYYPSNVEVEKVLSLSPDTDVSAIPLYMLKKPDLKHSDFSKREGLIFVGGFGHPPNKDAIKWFINDIFPTLKISIPEIVLNVVGSNFPEDILKLANENIIIHGFLTDNELTNLYEKVKICIVPLRYGAGVKGKVLEGLQAGLPIITTHIGAEGIPNAESIMIIANEPKDFADKIKELYNNPQLIKTYIDRYPDYIEKHFSQNAVDDVIIRDFLN